MKMIKAMYVLRFPKNYSVLICTEPRV